MGNEWSIIVLNCEKFWILKKDSLSNEYCLTKKPARGFGPGDPIKYFFADSPDDALEKGLELAKQHGIK